MSNANQILIFNGVRLLAGDIVELGRDGELKRFALIPSDSSVGDFVWGINETGDFVLLDPEVWKNVRFIAHEDILAQMLSEHDAMLENTLDVFGKRQDIIEESAKKGVEPVFGQDLIVASMRTDVRLLTLRKAIAEIVRGAFDEGLARV